jgi:hypothetical protein
VATAAERRQVRELFALGKALVATTSGKERVSMALKNAVAS